MPTSPTVNASRDAWRRESRLGTPLEIERIWEMPRKWTFQMPKVRAWVEERLEGKVLNLFGGVTRLTGDIHYNDINEDLAADTRKDAYDLAQWQEFKDVFDTVLLDPPYTAFQAVKTYGARKAQQVTHAREVTEYVLRPGGRVISLGFNSTGMSEMRGFEKEAILLVNSGGSHNDTIVMSERHRP